MKGLMLNQREQARLETLTRVLEERLRVSDAALVLRATERHAWRMLGRTGETEPLLLLMGTEDVDRQPPSARMSVNGSFSQPTRRTLG